MKFFKVFTSALLAISGSAFAGIVGTAHDIPGVSTTYNNANNDGQVCIYCHTPHNALNFTVPLWNHNINSAQTYTMYTSSTLDNTIASAPGDVSLACLSCHDGQTAVDSVAFSEFTASNGQMITGDPLIGTDLSNDHPIGITYGTADTAINSLATATAAGVTFYAGKVECASCHDPHSDTYNFFLRVDTQNSAICTACHNK